MGSAIKVNNKKIVLFDGVCNLCNSSVNFIISRNSKRNFYFASLQSELADKILNGRNLRTDSIVLIHDKNIFIKSAAVLRIARDLDGLWPLMNAFVIIPTPLRDFFYDLIAKYRYKLFGKTESCSIPTPEMKERFLDS